MSFLPPNQLSELINFAMEADREVRSELAKGLIKDENDYTSNFTGSLRRTINKSSVSGLSAKAFLLPTVVERKIGADAAIILTHGDESKIAVFEAKWPRFATTGYLWDSRQQSGGGSHFSHQLNRQRRWRPQLAVFEMIYCEYAVGKNPSFLDSVGSSCIWHDDAIAFSGQRVDPTILWTQAELQSLLTNKRQSTSQVFEEFGLCNQGKPIADTDPETIREEFALPADILVITAR